MPLLLTMTVLGFSGYAALLAVAPLWAVHGGADTAGAGLVNGVLILFAVLTQLCVPRALRRFGWGPILVTGMLLLGLPALAHGLSDALGPTLAFSAVRGLGFGILTVTGSALVAELVEPQHRGKAIGAYGLSIAAPQILFLSAGPWIAEQLDYWVVFAVAALPVVAVVPAIGLARMLDHVPEADEGKQIPYLLLPPPMALLTGVTLAGGALITFMAQMSSSAALTALALLLMNVAAALTRWQIGALSDRYGPHRFIAPLVLLTTAGITVVAWAVRNPQATEAPMLIVGATMVGISYGGLQNLTLVVTFQAVSRPHYGPASAVWNIGFDIGTGLGAVLVGMIAAGTSFSTALLVTGAFSLLTLPLALRRHTTKSRVN
ncbi:MFS transporter [Kocuria marina]|uniref:MFS transporter n=1 Tax=Kocuria marina TaxID=223184 RepID=UPI0034606EEB